MDYDADGDLDILSGSYTGELYLFERKADGSFIQGRYLLNNKGEDLKAKALSVTVEGKAETAAVRRHMFAMCA